jgi:hypothetical protein
MVLERRLGMVKHHVPAHLTASSEPGLTHLGVLEGLSFLDTQK